MAAYSKQEDDILDTFNLLKRLHLEEGYEVWEVKPDRYGNHYVIICRRKHRGRTPNLAFLRRLK